MGSMPGGDVERDANVEMDTEATHVGPFEIEIDPRPETGVTQAQARQACAADGKRLCSEVEWERACKGPEFLERPPAEPDSANGFGVRAMGVRLLEWTSSPWGKNLEDQTKVALRGATRTAAPSHHRCAHREGVLADATADYVGFRCCAGPESAALYKMPLLPRGDIFRQRRMEQDQFRAIVAQIPELRPVADGIMLFNMNDVASVLARGATTQEQHPELHFTAWPIEWQPTRGEDLLVFVAHNARHDVVAALYEIAGGQYRAAYVMILADDPIPLALAYGDPHGDSRRRIFWSPAWGQSEGGSVIYTEDRRVVITAR